MSTVLGKVEFSRIELGENPRKDLGDIEALANSIQKEGLINPLLVEHRKASDGKMRYILKAGFRRYAAIEFIRKGDKKAFAEVPVMLWKGNEDDARFLQIAENVQRKSLNPVELADALREMVNKGYADSEVADRVGLSTPWVQKLLKVREGCTPAVLKALAKGEISVAAAYDLVGCDAATQNRELDKYKDTKAKKGIKAAKRGAAKGAGKKVAPGKRTLSKLLAIIDVEEHAYKGEYWNGVTDALNYTLGASEDLIEAVESEARKHGIDLDSAKSGRDGEEE